jgi:4-hydroxyphenylacetate decarboxylase small subunit
MKKTHIDCKHFLAIDVFKGICKRDKNDILADELSCDSFKQVEKCSQCGNFTAEENGLGKCMQNFDAYPDMLAKTCEDFSWKQQLN